MTTEPEADGSSPEWPRVRHSARLLVLDPADRLLLFRIEDPALQEPRFWLTPGGGVEPGETHEQAAARELREETGIDAPIGPWVWVRRRLVAVGGRWLESRERFFVVHSPSSRVSDGAWTPLERRTITGWRWWPLAGLAAWDEAASGVLVPRRLAELLPPILAGDYPAEPIDAGR